MLAEWPSVRQKWDALTSKFAANISGLPGVRCAPGFGGGWVSSYALIELPHPFKAVAVAAKLATFGIETRRWWGPGCHLQPAYANCGRETLANTERLGDTVLGLPFFLGLQDEVVDEIFMHLRKILAGDSKP